MVIKKAILSNRYPCNKCGKAFAHPITLEIHMTQYHTDNYDLTPDADYMCKFCSHRARNKQLIIKHINDKHISLEAYLCDVCGKSFLSSRNLKAHSSIHKEERTFVCKICSKAFKIASSLRVHMRTHMENRKNICDECGKIFKKKYSLVMHKRQHRGLFLYNCHVCEKKFVAKTLLNMHLKRHGEKDLQMNE